MKIGYKPPLARCRDEFFTLRLRPVSVNLNSQTRRRLRILSAIVVTSLVGLLVVTQTNNRAWSNRVQAAPVSETVMIFADDCSTPKTTFFLGETVCAVVRGAPTPSNGWRQRYFQWVTPNQWQTQQTDIVQDKQIEFYVIPSSGEFARVGKWSVRTVDSEPGMQTITHFYVRDPRLRLVDLKAEKIGPVTIHPGDRIEYRVWAHNVGSETARNVLLNVRVPEQTVFLGIKQVAGNEFRCETPPRGENGTVRCTIVGMLVNESASFILYYQVNPDARDDSLSISNAELRSDIEEADKDDNLMVVEATVVLPRQDGGDPGEP
ncbi:MAG TPA: hypothetical protein VIB00_03370 [Pyrinomonadaceae bacterium]